MPFTFQTASVQVVAGGQQAVFSPPPSNGKTVGIVARAPFGPDYPMFCNRSTFLQLYGDPTNVNTAGYAAPFLGKLLLDQRQPQNNTIPNVVMCRVGVQRAGLSILDANGVPCFVLQGIGPYAGTKGTKLKVAVVQSGTNTNEVQSIATTGTPTGGSLTLGFQGVPQTGTIAWNSTSTAAATALATIPQLAGNIAVAGGPLPATPLTVTYNTALGNAQQPLLTVVANALSGGTNPQVNVTETTPGSAVVVSSITVTDTSVVTAGLQKYQWTNARDGLANVASIAAAINGLNKLRDPGSFLQAVQINTNAGIPATLAATPLVGGNDGAGASSADGTIATLLQQSLDYHIDYFISEYDAAAIFPSLNTHITAAAALNEYRNAYLGPAAGTAYATLLNTYLSGASISNERFRVVGHDTITLRNPITGKPGAYGGPYAAAIACGMKAVGPTQETSARYPLAGVLGIPNAPDKSGALASAELDALAGAGYITMNPSDTAPGFYQIRDAQTTAPFSIAGGVNLFSMPHARDVDDTFNAAMAAAAQPHVMRTYLDQSATNQAILSSGNQAAARLTGTTISAASLQVTRSPDTGQPMLAGTYVMPMPVLGVQVPTQIVLG